MTAVKEKKKPHGLTGKPGNARKDGRNNYVAARVSDENKKRWERAKKKAEVSSMSDFINIACKELADKILKK